MAKTAVRAIDLPIKVPKKGQVDYNRCTFEELQAFVAARGLKHQARSTRYAARELIVTLQRADDNPSFPYFFELAPEMRNRIYDELLVFDPDTGFAHPQILASCRAANNEAKNIMCTKNVAVVRIDFGIMPTYAGHVDHKVSMGGPLARANTEHLEFLITGPIRWPRALLKFEHVQVDIRLGYGSLGVKRILRRNQMNGAVATLGSFLEESERLKRVTVKGDFDAVLKGNHTTTTELVSMLYPISRLYAKKAQCDFVFKGFQACREVARALINNANAHHDFYQTTFLRKLALVGLELYHISELGERNVPRGIGFGLCSNDLEQKVRAIEPELLRLGGALYDNIEDEKKLMECADRAASLYTEFAKTGILKRKAAHQEKYGSEHTCASCEFHRVHHMRIRSFPEEE
ncbi:hypothetical protein BDY17DRAFT_306522 [Neohortaea acidophila]|uniref:Uncharacterized protein n=1 Tax=Neohortaea acidophila TaxID=245834 RepID=A0A6A6Q3U7_9PEZI|nr:uncharacterized protein BDY17DRAFT_306522 [Neohortaea acidophila]KAF2487080.1 hypothetical protein BDY17DRAFT_306522 [Neohortaea acidophila]